MEIHFANVTICQWFYGESLLSNPLALSPLLLAPRPVLVSRPGNFSACKGRRGDTKARPKSMSCHRLADSRGKSMTLIAAAWGMLEKLLAADGNAWLATLVLLATGLLAAASTNASRSRPVQSLQTGVVVCLTNRRSLADKYQQTDQVLSTRLESKLRIGCRQ